MTTSTTESENVQSSLGRDQRPRAIVHRTRGKSNGSITRLVSPSDLGGVIKPFVFLDRFESDGRQAPPLEFGWHPHSGIATVTVVLDGSVKYAETTGNAGVLPAGGVEWMQAGGGVWHTGGVDSALVRGFQLWVALPPELESAPNRSQYVLPEQIPSAGPVRVILGTYDGMTSPIASPPMTYLVVTLKDRERWTFHPPLGHDVAWVSVMDGVLNTSSRITHGEAAIFERAETAVELVAEGDTRFVLGSASLHPHELVLGYYSVHTSAEALSRGEAEIRRIGRQLRNDGKQSYALRSI
ncbi:pirin family protein [Burkholderia lata]|uniref:Pirin family protein n=1 Tax=Burkholderia lata (strain ATCC 17760 / DSM 23089 / LMG 22485 / NCIMB 9086 / R18194 / 383) TaxID=482957 RepID=A0A6P2RLA9_BURL3|nr:pirin family protein [Burkholderia lata]VWC36048.1 pirin family protein [Burkholderia lata]